MMSKFILILVALGCLGLTIPLQNSIQKGRPDIAFTGEMRFLPNGKTLDLTSGGIHGAIADILWLRALNYITSHFGADRDFAYLLQLFDIITDYDPHFVRAYKYGGFLLSSAALEAKQAATILEKGVKNNPTNWELQYDLAHVYSFWLKDLETSAYYFSMAAQTATNQGKDALILFEQANDYYLRQGGYEASRQMWAQFAQSPDPKRRKMAEEQIKRVNARETMDQLQKAVDLYTKERGTTPPSLSALIGMKLPQGKVTHIPRDPFGEEYFLHEGKVECWIFRRDEHKKRLVYLRRRLDAYFSTYGRYPVVLNDLFIDTGKEVPPSQLLRPYRYDPLTGEIE